MGCTSQQIFSLCGEVGEVRDGGGGHSLFGFLRLIGIFQK
jgi:hypothetical protein